MSGPLKREYESAWYHVMNRERRSDWIFDGQQDYQIFIELLKDAIELWNVHISAYCLMPNHYHLLNHTPMGNLYRSMAIYLDRKLRKDSLPDIGSEFGLKGHSSVSSVLDGMKKQLQKIVISESGTNRLRYWS